MRSRKAVALSVLEFAVFYAIQQQRDKQMISSQLVDTVYRGVKEPPAYPFETILKTTKNMNPKLAHLGLKLRAINRRHNSFYRLERI